MKDHKEYRKELVDALRSGEYRQGKFRLKEVAYITPTTLHCPLGIACEVYQKHHIRTSKWVQWNDTVWGFLVDGCPIMKNVLPYKVRDFFGISSYQIERIIQMNDSFRKTFDEIADFIEMEV